MILDNLMLSFDSIRVVVYGAFLTSLIVFYLRAWQSRNVHRDDEIIQQHFLEHSIASFFAFLGSSLGFVWSIVHLFSVDQNTLPEIPFTVSSMLLIAGAFLFVVHMTKEQTPGHPFYQREVGEEPAPRKRSPNSRGRRSTDK